MEIIDKDLLEILACPYCHSSLRPSGNRLICFSEKCRNSFPIKGGIPVLLPPGLEKSEDYGFKQAQIDFFDHWSSRERGEKVEIGTSFDRFFSPVVGEKRINYSEGEMRQLIEKLSKNSLVLEIGCGAGEHTAFLGRLRGDIHLTAIDLSLKSAIETRERIKKDKRVKGKVSLVVADAEFLPFKERVFGGITSVMLFHHMASPRKPLKEIKRTLRSEGIGLVVDFIADNPLVVLPRKAFPYLPFWIKKRWGGDYLLENGEIPLVSVHHSKEIKEDIKNAQLKVVREEKYDLFVFVLGTVGAFFPLSKYFFPETILKILYVIDKRLVKIEPFRRFAGATSLWLSH